MPKISELFDESKPGSVKLTKSICDSGYFFRPFFYDRHASKYFGLDVKGKKVENPDTEDWQLWQEPKKTKIVYEWMYNIKNSPDWAISTTLMSEEAAKFYFNTEYKKTGRQFEVGE